MVFLEAFLTLAGWWTVLMGIFIIFLIFKVFTGRGESIKEKDVAVDEQRLLDWKPYPLVETDVEPVESKLVGKINDNNLGATSFLALGNEDRIIDEAIAALRKYGVGSCGPRGFYGTIDVHLDLEERLAKFMGCEEAVVYSYGFTTIASAIPAYARKGDILFVDESVHFAIQKGIDASRSMVRYFRHNDMEHLEELIIQEADIIAKKRSFIIAEAIYYNSGTICPLPKMVELRKKYKLRMILDESLSIGVLGEKGKGLTEHFNIPISEVDLIVGSLEHSFSSIGGFCVGSHFIVEHQRLSGLGYCFSASLPPLLSQGAITALDLIESEPSRLEDLRNNSEKLNRSLEKLNDFRLSGHDLSPIKHIYIRDDKLTVEEKQTYLEKIANYCGENGLTLSVATYLRESEKSCPEPSIRLAANSRLSQEKIDKLSTLLTEGYKLLKI